MRPYLALLTQEEHAALLKLGTMAGFARHGVRPSRGPALLEKIAQASVTTSVGNMINLALKTSIIAGIPLGAAWHLVGRAATADDRVEKEQRARIKYYSDVGRNLQQGITGPKSL